MLKVAVLVSGGGTNLQAILDAIDEGRITNAQVDVVISNNPGAYALERAKGHGIEALCISPKDYENRAAFNEAFLAKLDSYQVDLVVLAGFLVVIPEQMIARYRNRIINIHPSLIPSFCGKGFYGLKVHEGALARGVKVTGATVHFVDEGTDTGPIILQKPVAVEEGDTPEILQRRVMEQAEWIILPQAIRTMIPSIINQFIITLKDTSILSVIGFPELVNTAKNVVANTMSAFQVWTIVAVMYLVVITLLSRLAKKVERRLNRGRQ